MLIRDVGQSAHRARRYRALVELAEAIFDRTLVLGSDIRRAARVTDRPTAAIKTAVAELRSSLASCWSAIDDVRTSQIYRDAVAHFSEGEAERAATGAIEIFASVVPHAATDTLYWAMPIRGERSGAHFLEPEECASRLSMIAAEGVPAAAEQLDLGGDEAIRPVLLTDEHDGSESPIALTFEPGTLPGRVCRLDGSNVALFYAERLRADFTVRCTPIVSDEWWSIRPDAYREYVVALRQALARQAPGIPFEP